MRPVNTGSVCVRVRVCVRAHTPVTGSEPRHCVSLVFTVPGAGGSRSAHTEISESVTYGGQNTWK